MWRQFVNCPTTEAHERHLEQLKRMNTAAARREYVDNVTRAEGKFAAQWLRDDFAKWHEEQQRKAKPKP